METAVLILFIPLIASFLSGLGSFFQMKGRDSFAKMITCLGVGFAAIASLVLAYTVIIEKQIIHIPLMDWIAFDRYVVSWGVYADMLTATMVCVVTWVSFAVHVYSIGYMAHDHSVARFMSYLSLFTFFMVLLVMSDNLLQLFVGWEGVGLCSYLLIGFWYEKPSANAASMKAFITNRVGDMGMALGIVGCIIIFQTASVPEIISQLPEKATLELSIAGYKVSAYTFITLCLFIGAMAKSAQFGLHVWLPDAMEGPTPVSALIHAATMVTAGVFLLIRMSFLFDLVPSVQMIILAVGAITAIFAAIVGLFQQDIKRVVAYSTCSQLGYMMMACGISMYSAALFHLVTHAFFKALLFLSAGSVIHAMSGEQDVSKMGGLYKKIPITYAFIWIGSLAFAGIPFFAGYYSKDWILESLYSRSEGNLGLIPYCVGVIAAFLTAFYSWRLIYLTFHGDSRADKHVQSHVHESPLPMLAPKCVLAVGAVLGGYSLHSLFASADLINKAYATHFVEEALPTLIQHLPLFVALSGILLAVLVYHSFDAILDRLKIKNQSMINFIKSGFGIDKLYQHLIINPLWKIGGFFSKTIDRGIIDGWGPNASGKITVILSEKIKSIQTGRVADYAVTLLIGIILMLGYGAWVVK